MRLLTLKKDVRVWKVVRVLWDNRLLSFIDFLPVSWTVTYRKGVWTYPTQKGTALYAFKTKRQAQEFIMHSNRYQIWLCTGDIVDGKLHSSLGRGGLLISSGIGTWQKLKRFWLDPQNHHIQTRLAPEGTVACRRLRLEKRVS